MLVCRDLEKAKADYGFVKDNYFSDGVIVKELADNFYCYVRHDKTVIFHAWDCWDEDINLDFLYDMIKDGVIEKVAE